MSPLPGRACLVLALLCAALAPCSASSSERIVAVSSARDSYRNDRHSASAVSDDEDDAFLPGIETPFESEQDHASFLQEFKTLHSARTPSRADSTHALHQAVHHRAMLFFRSLDADHDQYISPGDVAASPAVLAHHLPKVAPHTFVSFIEAADMDHDGKLNADEFISGLVEGLQVTPASALMELDAAATSRVRARARAGVFGSVVSGLASGVGSAISGAAGAVGGAIAGAGKAIGNMLGAGGGAAGAAGKTQASDEGCAICQYIVERAETNVRQSGVIPSMSASPSPEGIYLELESTMLSRSGARAAASVAVEAQAHALAQAKAKAKVEAMAQATDPFDMAGATIIGTTRQSTRYQRLMERQKYNEIYRIVDITLDDVCEQGMPNTYYAFCKAVYQTQADVVDGLRYQYRPADICFRVGMCDASSYITKGIHSRYAAGAGGKS